MKFVSLIIFLASALLLLAPYFIYPIIIYIASLIRPKPVKKGDIEPMVTLLISAYNEAAHIGKKLENSFDLNYPKEKLEIVVVADGSTDGTKDVVEKYANKGVRLFWSPERKGKLRSISDVWQNLSGNIVVFSDANNLYVRDTIKALVANFADPTVGAVCGEKHIMDNEGTNNPVAAGEGAYWRFENFIKNRESLVSSICGAMGELYAIRKELVNPHTFIDVIDDSLYISLKTVLSGYRLVWEPDAKSYERASKSFSDEFKRKARIVAAGLQTVGKIPQILAPISSPIWLQMIFHKALKWLAPLFLILVFISSWSMPEGDFKYFVLLAQLAFYLLAAINIIPPIARRRIKIFYLPYYFCLGNFAALAGLFRWILKKQPSLWEKVER